MLTKATHKFELASVCVYLKICFSCINRALVKNTFALKKAVSKLWGDFYHMEFSIFMGRSLNNFEWITLGVNHGQFWKAGTCGIPNQCVYLHPIKNMSIHSALNSFLGLKTFKSTMYDKILGHYVSPIWMLKIFCNLNSRIFRTWLRSSENNFAALALVNFEAPDILPKVFICFHSKWE